MPQKKSIYKIKVSDFEIKRKPLIYKAELTNCTIKFVH